MGYNYCSKTGTNVSESSTGCSGTGQIVTFDPITITNVSSSAHLCI